MITYAIGDVHGCLEELEQLYARITDYHNEKYLTEPMKLVFVGDYIDRGPNSKGVVDFILALKNVHEVVTLRGNHEDMFLHDFGLCLGNGGFETLKSYGWAEHTKWKTNYDGVPKEHMEFFRSTQLYHQDSMRTYVHAGIYRHLGEMKNQYERVMLWVRHEFLQDDSMDGGYVVHGHTPIGVEKMPNRLNVDSACVFGGCLTAAVFEETQVEPVHIIQSDRHSKKGPY